MVELLGYAFGEQLELGGQDQFGKVRLMAGVERIKRKVGELGELMQLGVRQRDGMLGRLGCSGWVGVRLGVDEVGELPDGVPE